MDAILRAAAMYLFLLIVFRIAGKRTLSDSTTFEVMLLLVISETTQQAMVQGDSSMGRAFLLIVTFVFMNVVFSVLKQRSTTIEKILDGTPVVVLENGHPITKSMNRVRVDEEDILEAARELHGLERLEQIKFAILERSGKLSIIPKLGAD